jgi:hypothetical protein
VLLSAFFESAPEVQRTHGDRIDDDRALRIRLRLASRVAAAPPQLRAPEHAGAIASEQRELETSANEVQIDYALLAWSELDRFFRVDRHLLERWKR